MTLIASISGIRGTIGGSAGKNLTPVDIVRFTSAYGVWLTTKTESRVVVVGRDARKSGEMVNQVVTATLVGLGFEVIDLGLSTTPTVELAVPEFQAAGGIIITASHNPGNWNALKLLNYKGEFVSRKDGEEILEILEHHLFIFEPVENMGIIRREEGFVSRHIEKIKGVNLVDAFAIEKENYKIVVDGINSSGGVFVPQLLRELGVKDIIEINCEPNGEFAHDPEPLAKNLQETCAKIREVGADLGIVVDPDVDRLVMIDENGNLFGEEYTIVAVADYVLKVRKGAVVSNLSSSRALRDIAERYGCPYKASAVGEVNVIEKMKRHDAVIGGEGNGGVILPELHYGRDALIGIALFLSHLAKEGKKMSELRSTYPDYFMSKQKVELAEDSDPDSILEHLKTKFANENINDVDGVKIDFEDSWVHLRKSNTEPILRIYSEAPTMEAAEELANKFKEEISAAVPM